MLKNNLIERSKQKLFLPALVKADACTAGEK